MVKRISPALKTAISSAITRAERRTSAEIAVVLAPESDGYQAYLLMYGFAAGSIACTFLWWTKTLTAFPVLMLVQALAMGSFVFIPLLRRLGMTLMPRRLLHYCAARRAAEEFQSLSQQVPPERPLVLLYVSLAERYAHILHSRMAGAKIPTATWDGIVASFAAGVEKPGLSASFDIAIAKIGEALAPHVPDKGEPNVLRDGPG